MRWKLLFLLAVVAGFACADPAADDPPAGQPPAAGSEQPPIRVELGGYANYVDHGYGTWEGSESQIWFRGNRYFVPAIMVESQTRPTGTQQNVAFFSYLNWSKSFYTVQGFSAAPQRDAGAIYFPKRRYDIKAYKKLTSGQNFVLGAGYTRFDLGAAGHGQIFNLSSLYYHGKLVLEGNLFVNRSQPGDLYSASGTVSAQYGREGRYWFGVTAGGGRELYQYVGQTPFEVQFASYSLRTFYRKWFTRHVGAVVSFDYLDKVMAYRRTGGSIHLFFEF
jgi:YaiO family outer membrane protein